MSPRLLLHELTRKEIGAIAARALLILPTGAIEHHDPHLPVGTDYFVVERVAQAAAAEVAIHL
jgi:creatinine amidohydrolase/Fe(II)-dependent formamide hydrolase-like protein